VILRVKSGVCSPALFPLPQQYVLFRQAITPFPRKAPFDAAPNHSVFLSACQQDIHGRSHILTGSVIASAGVGASDVPLQAY
jgi:hypothetical protein